MTGPGAREDSLGRGYVRGWGGGGFLGKEYAMELGAVDVGVVGGKGEEEGG